MDTRFKSDAIVLIIAKVEAYHEYLQMLGRGSRTRGVCDGILYTVSKDKEATVRENLKRQNFAAMNDLAALLKHLEENNKDRGLMAILTKAEELGEPIRSLAHIEAKAATSKRGRPKKDQKVM
jgi:superfamily II DNA or RNA helicase